MSVRIVGTQRSRNPTLAGGSKGSTVTIDPESISSPARVASPEEGVSRDELQLAARNHGMPLESLRWDITPPGLHYLLTHYDIPAIDPTGFELVVDGLVDAALSLDLDAIQRRPRISAIVTLECAGNGRAQLLPRPVSQPWLTEAVGTARWSGTSLSSLLREAGVADGPLPPQHGAPLRLIVPGWYGMAHVKWVRRITVVGEKFDGFQMRAYRLRDTADEQGIPLTRIEPRALLMPPGFPDFMSRRRVVRSGAVKIEGRAWSGWAPVSRVEVSIDGGDTWELADLDTPQDLHGWAHWTWTWESDTGSFVLACRATDASGRTQPLGQRWSRGGFANNTIQRVPVTVISSEM